jgi:hypothetical protein
VGPINIKKVGYGNGSHFYLMMMTQAAGSLTTYGLLVWDSQLETPSENMDDYLFYTKALTKGLEFILATAIVVGGNEPLGPYRGRWVTSLLDFAIYLSCLYWCVETKARASRQRNQCCGSGAFLPLDPGSGMGKKSRARIRDLIFENLV